MQELKTRQAVSPISSVPFQSHTLCLPRLLAPSAYLLLLISSSAINAQTSPPATPVPPATSPAAESNRLEEVVVTARRREESLQNVPIAVSAFTAKRINDLQAKDLSGLQYATPNLYLDKGDASNAVIFIRGVGQNDSLAFADPSIGVYVDDVFIARTQAAFLDLFDVERVEVLRGPQGTLYGRNTIGGAVKFVSTRPSVTTNGYLETSAGNFNAFSLKGRIGGEIIEDTLRGKVALAINQRNGYNRNTISGKDDGDVKSLAGRASLLFTPSSQLEFLLSADAKSDRPDSSRSAVRVTPITVAVPAVTTIPASTNNYTVDTNANGLNDLSARGVTLTTRYTISDALKIEAITAYRNMQFDLNLDADGTRFPVLDILVKQKQRQFSQELRLSYDNERDFTLTSGLYYFYDRDTTFSGVDNGAATIFGLPVTQFGFPTSQLARTTQNTDSTAVFTDATYALSNQLNLSAGVRYTRENRTSGREFENYFNPALSVLRNTPPFLAGRGTPGTPINGRVTFDAVTPKLSLAYKPDNDTMLYASVARGFKSGGFDGRANSKFGFTPFRPEFVWSYEGGAKTSQLDGSLVANVAVFYNNYSDIQVTSFGADPVTGVFSSLFTNAAKARTYGVELEVFAKPSKELTLNATVGRLNARYQKFNILVGTEVTDVSNRPLVNAPDWNGSLGATYKVAVANSLSATFHLDAAYRSKTVTEITASPLLTQSSYTLLNGFVALGAKDSRWELRAGVQNATNKAIRTQGFNLASFPGVQLSFFNAPRTYDLKLTYRY